MEASEFLERYAAGERSFRHVNLDGADLTEENLSGAELVGANLFRTRLEATNLSGANLLGANLVKAILRQADLTQAKLVQTNLAGAFLEEANLTAAELVGANLHQAELIGANLSHADLSCANLSKSNLTHAILDGVNLKGVNLYQAKGIDNCLASNQGSNADLQWENLNFRSHAEIQIAKALDRAGVLFYPNCRCRLNITIGRGNRESDFLVFHQGRWGILEVDGEHWHPPCRAVEDHERDRLFKAHGILFVEHYDADRCSKEPNEVVREFLQILSWTAQH